MRLADTLRQRAAQMTGVRTTPYARLAPGGVQDWRAYPHRPAGLPHPWGATGRCQGSSTDYYGVLLL